MKNFDKTTIEEREDSKETLSNQTTNDNILEEENLTEQLDSQSENASFNPRSLSFWIGLVAVVLGTVEAILIAFNVKLEINLLVEGLSTILFTLVCLGILKTNKDVKKEDIEADLKKNLKSKKKKSQDKE